MASSGPASNAATTTQAATSPYPAAQPGAAAVPAPTPYLPRAQPEPTRTTLGAQDQNAPPPPQPGAAPSPYGYIPSPANSIPPPPRAGETPRKQGTAFTAALNSMYTPPPPASGLQQNYAPTHSTSTAGIQPGQPVTPARVVGGLTMTNLGPVAFPPGYSPAEGGQDRRVSTEHPQGYVQNAYAQDLSPAQRASLEQETRRGSFVDSLGLGGDSARRSGEGWQEGAQDVWNTAKGWLGKAGSALAETEEQVWKRINGR